MVYLTFYVLCTVGISIFFIMKAAKSLWIAVGYQHNKYKDK